MTIRKRTNNDLQNTTQKLRFVQGQWAENVDINCILSNGGSLRNKFIDDIISGELQKPADTPRKVIESLLSFPTPSK